MQSQVWRRFLSGRRASVYTAVALACWLTMGGAEGGGGCGEPEAPPPVWSQLNGPSHNLALKYQPPSSAPAHSVDVTVAVVDPFYRDQDNTHNEGLYRPVAKGWSTSMGVDLDNILVAKGMTTTGPFTTVDDLTYSEKKNCIFVLVPKVYITMEVKFGDVVTQWAMNDQGVQEWRGRHPVQIKISGFVSYVLEESLTGEKMFVKKLDLDEATYQGTVEYLAEPVYTQSAPDLFGQTTPIQSGWKYGDTPVSDSRINALRMYINHVYPQVMEKAWTYLDPSEMMQLKAAAEDIRSKMKFTAH